MRKLILGVGVLALSFVLFVKSEVPVAAVSKFDAIKAEVGTLITQVIADKEEREKVAHATELKIAMAVGELNKLQIDGNITIEDLRSYSTKYAQLWGQIYLWKGTDK